MEIKVGEYIRWDLGIGKVRKIETDEEDGTKYYYLDSPRWAGVWEESIAKHSQNITDLIEERRLCEWNESIINISSK